MAVHDAVLQRDESRCRLAGSTAGPCFGGLTVHHLRKASQIGPYTVHNLLTLCVGHNEWVETSPAAHLVDPWGLVIRSGGSYAQTWARLQFAGLVTYWWDGRPAHQDPPDAPEVP